MNKFKEIPAYIVIPILLFVIVGQIISVITIYNNKCECVLSFKEKQTEEIFIVSKTNSCGMMIGEDCPDGICRFKSSDGKYFRDSCNFYKMYDKLNK